MVLGKRGLDVRKGVRFTRTRLNARLFQPIVRWERFEQIDCTFEEVWYLFRWLVIGVAVRVERRDTCAMLAPFVFPEGFCGAGVGGPVGVHVLQERLVAGCGKNGGDVGISSAVVTVGIVCPVAIVRLHEFD